MKIIYKQGNLIEAEEDIIVHGCNAAGVMGSGVAAAIRGAYPSAFHVYMQAHRAGELKLGQSSWAHQPNGKLIINAVTQEFYGNMVGVRYVDYDAVRTVMQDLNWFAEEAAKTNQPEEGYYMAIAMPKIGAGLGNGDWNIIEKIIEDESHSFQPVVYIL